MDLSPHQRHPRQTPQDSRTILSEIQLIASNNTQSIPTPPITIKEFERIIIDTPERTSSSPSRRHLGHYKAALQSSNLLYLLCQLTSLPFQFGFTPTRWTTSIDTMLEKSPGNPHKSKLRIIQLLRTSTSASKSSGHDVSNLHCRPTPNSIQLNMDAARFGPP